MIAINCMICTKGSNYRNNMVIYNLLAEKNLRGAGGQLTDHENAVSCPSFVLIIKENMLQVQYFFGY